MSRTSLTRTWKFFDRFHSGLAYHNTMHQCMEYYWSNAGVTPIRFKRYEPAVIPF